MNRLFINGRFLTQPITGVQRYAIEVVQQWDSWLRQGTLDRRRWEITLVAPRSGIVHDLGLHSIPLEMRGRLTGHAWEQFELPGLTKGGALFCPCNTAPFRSLREGNQTIVTVHDLSHRYFPGAYSWAFRTWYDMLMPAIFKRAARILTVAQCEKRAMLEHFPHADARIGVVQNGCLAPESALVLASESTPLPIESPYLLYVGSLSRRKNVQGVIAASEVLFREFPNLKTVLVGGGTKVFNMREFPIPEEIRDRFLFRGQVNDAAEIFGLYRRAACFLFPSYYEASPLPPMEAMATGCPVVASAIPSHHERLGDAALYCDPDDASDIARKVASVLRDEGVASGLRSRGIKRASEFTWHRCALETLRAIDDVMTKKATPLRRAA